MCEKHGEVRGHPGRFRKSGADISDTVSDLPRAVLSGAREGVDHGHDGARKAMSDLPEATRSAVDILRNTAEEATRALRQIAAEYAGSELKYSEKIGEISAGTQQ